MPHKTIERFVAEELRRSIVDGNVKPGHRLVEQEVAAELGVSRTPVRSALRKLEAEGLVSIIPHKGAIVAKLSLAEIEEDYIIRTALEGLAARYSAERITQEQLSLLKDLLQQMDRALADGDVELMLQLNKEFHLNIYSACGLDRLGRIIGELWQTVEPYRRAYVNLPQRAERAAAEHWEILQALEARNAGLADRLTRAHLLETATALTRYLRASGENGRVETQTTEKGGEDQV